MASKSNKSNKEKKELDFILAQLKKNYNEDAIEDTREEDSSSSEIDSEFSEMLGKFFASEAPSHTNTIIDTENDIPEEQEDDFPSSDNNFDEETVDPTIPDNEIAKTEDFNKVDTLNKPDSILKVDDNVEAEDVHEISCEDIVASDVGDSFFNRSESENNSEEDVDGVLQLMFSSGASSSVLCEGELVEEKTVVEESAVVQANVVIEEDLTIEEDIDTDEVYDESNKDDFDDIVYPEDEEAFDKVLSLGSEEPSQPFSIDEDEEPSETEVINTFTVMDEEYGIEDDEFSTREESTCLKAEVKPRIILDPEQYTFDPLQDVLPDLATDGIESKEAFAKDHTISDDIYSEVLLSATTSETESLDSNDISLLLKFGYDEEVKAHIGEDEAQRALAEKTKNYRPESHKIPYGFCGKEFSNKEQAKQIKEKYKSDKNFLTVQIIIIALLTVVMIAVEFFFEFWSDRSSYLVVNAVELILIIISAVIINKKLISGILGIVRFEANLYSILAYLIFSYAICNIATALIYVIRFPTVDTSGFMVFGLCVMLYILLVLISELINCLREAEAFNLICRSNNIYTAEKHISASSMEINSSRSAKAYRLTKASIISGYFKKSSMSISSNVNLIYVIGIVPILSLILGCISAIVSENVMQGIFSMMITTFLCIPFACIVLPPVTEYVYASLFRKQRIALVGSDTAESLAKADELFFDDTDAVEVISYTEILPSKNAEGEKTLDIARRVFASLDGPLGKYVSSQAANAGDEAIKKGEIVINSISDNGIDIYFESSMNVLIGDKAYMQAHNIKVKTDSNLRTSISGVDRSIIYMAFDGIPKLGFIISSRVRSEFSRIAALLDDNSVKVYVDSYEPEINDLYFEQNTTANTSSVSVCKSEEYESTGYKEICDGNIVCASSSFDLAKAILDCRKVVDSRKKNQRTILALILCGVIFSALFTALLSIDHAVFILSGLKAHVSLVFNVLMVILLVPAIVSAFKMRENKKKETDKSKETD